MCVEQPILRSCYERMNLVELYVRSFQYSMRNRIRFFYFIFRCCQSTLPTITTRFYKHHRVCYFDVNNKIIFLFFPNKLECIFVETLTIQK